MYTNDVENPRTRKFIRDKLKMPRYGFGNDIYIEEFFMRMQYVLNLSPHEFIESIENFSRSVRKIVYDKGEGNCMGYYDPSEKSIHINTNYFENLTTIEEFIEFYEAFCHECLHGTQVGPNGRNRTERYNKKIKNRAQAICEICTQGTAAKMARNRNIEQYKKREVLTGRGYQDEIFAVPLLASAFGVKEQDFLKFGQRKRAELVDVLDKNIGNKKVTESLLDRLEEQLEYIHSVSYPDEEQTEFIGLSRNAKCKIASKAMKNIISLCEEVFAYRIKNLPLSFDKNAYDNLSYDYNNMKRTLSFEYKKYGDYFFTQENNSKSNEYGEYSNYVRYCLACLSKLKSSWGKNYRNSTPSIIAALKTANYSFLESFPFLRNVFQNQELWSGTYLNPINRIDEEHVSVDYNNLRDWDNINIFLARHNSMILKPRKRIDTAIWTDIHTEEGNRKFFALRMAMKGNKNKHDVRSSLALFDIIDVENGIFHNSVYKRFTRDKIPEEDGRQYGGMSPREIIHQEFSTQDDQIFLASLIADRFIDKLFDENGKKKKVESKEEYVFQTLLSSTITKYGIRIGNPQNGINQAKFALKGILLNDDYEGISGEENREIMSVYGKKGVFDIISQPLVDELLSERRIIPEKKRALAKIVEVTENTNECDKIIASVLNSYRYNGYDQNLSKKFGIVGRMYFNNYFREQRDFEDMLGIICDSYSTLNYRANTIDNKKNPDIQRVLNELGPDEFREAVIDIFFKGKTYRINNPEHLRILSNDPLSLIERLANSYVENQKIISRNEEYLSNYSPVIPEVKLEDIGEVARAEFKKQGVYKKIKGFFIGIHEMIQELDPNSYSKSKDIDDDFSL